MGAESHDEKEKQLVITLALVQKALQDLVDKVNIHQKVLFGNGDPQNSVTWCLRGLMESVKRVEDQIKEFTQSAADAKREASAAATAATAAKELAATVADTAKQLALSANKPKDDELTWNQTIKKMMIKAPYVIAILGSVAMLHKPAGELIVQIIKLITK
jgi:hypothetical protein